MYLIEGEEEEDGEKKNKVQKLSVLSLLKKNQTIIQVHITSHTVQPQM